MNDLRSRVVAEVGKVVVGQDDAVEHALIALCVGGHVLIEGVPGVAKTLMARCLAATLDLRFRRLQFTPDMLPSDVTGTVTLRGGELSFRPGPIFTNILLADEINRTPPKTQAALLEAMQERQVTVDAESHQLTEPFFVIATQNPIEYEGTYPLPEAQLDRFILQIDMDYPSEESERSMLRQHRTGIDPSGLTGLEAVADKDAIQGARSEVDATKVSDEIAAYVVALARRTRSLPSIALGASPRAAVHLLAASKAAACLDGRDFVTPDDVARMAYPVLGHRLLLNPEAELENFRARDAVEASLASVPVPR